MNEEAPHDRTNELPRSVIYLRFATRGTRAATALEMCTRRANELGAIVVAEYVDVGPDLTDDREQLRAMLADLAMSADIDYVIVPEHATIARDMHIYTRVAWRIQQAGAQLVVAAFSLDQYQQMSADPRGLMQAVADWANEEGGAPGNSRHDDDRKSNNKEVELD